MYNTSKGEQKIINILKGVRANFKREHSFKDLKSLRHKPLRFDFILMDNSGNIQAALEFDGQQHFKYDKHFSKSLQEFRYRQESDLRKNSYCLINRIPLYRIPYYDFDNINSYNDLFKPQYLVRDKFHNHYITHALNKI